MALKIVKAGAQQSVGYVKQAKYGKAGSGKSLTSLLEAEMLASLDPQKRRVLVLDTEGGYKWYRIAVPERSVHPEAFDFDLISTRSIADAIEAFETLSGDYCAFILDSVTHLWETAQAAYTGKRMSNGQIPIQAWGQIKRPWKRMMQLALEGNFHLTLCGREGVVIDDSAEGEMKVVGARMKSEGETPFEPDLLWRMVPDRAKDGSPIIQATCEKDRSGILSAKTFQWPSGETIRPLVRYLGGDQPQMGDTDASAARDAAAAEAEELRKKGESDELFATIKRAIQNADSIDALKAAWLLTNGKKTKLGDDYMTQLDAAKESRKSELIAKVA